MGHYGVIGKTVPAMGQMDVARLNPEELRAFIRALLRDVHALERMLSTGMIESGRRRVGCEQEMFLVDRAGKPFPIAIEILDRLADPSFTTELGRFNLEVNLAPRQFEGDCLSRTEEELRLKLSTVRAAAHAMDAEVALTGILPTLRKSDLALDNISPRQRYYALNEAMTGLGRGYFEFHLRGADELNVRHDSVMLESCCTSFQVHYQADPETFANLYNIAQAVTAPLLAAAVNSDGGSGWRPGSPCFSTASTREARRRPFASDPPASVSGASGWSARRSNCFRRILPASRSCSARRSTKIPWRYSGKEEYPRSGRSRSTTERSTGGIASITE